MSIGDLIERIALSKEGIGGLIGLMILVAFALGYNWYRVQSVFSKVHNNKTAIVENEKEISENEIEIKENKERLDKGKKKRESLNRTLRIIACNSSDLANNDTAQNMLECGDFQ